MEDGIYGEAGVGVLSPVMLVIKNKSVCAICQIQSMVEKTVMDYL